MKENKIKEIFDPKLGARITHSQKIWISDHRFHISDHRSQITDLISHKSGENLMMLRSLENLANLSPQIKWEKELIKSGASTALLELVLRTELKII